MSEAVFVEAPARLHFGVLDLRGDLGRRFGGIGAAGSAPSLLLEAPPAPPLKAQRPHAAPAPPFARPVAPDPRLGPRPPIFVDPALPPPPTLRPRTHPSLA